MPSEADAGGCRRTVDNPLSQSAELVVLDEESGREGLLLPLFCIMEAPISLAGELFSCDAKLWREQYIERIFDWWASVSDIRRLGTETYLLFPAALDMPAKRLAMPPCPL